MPVTDSDGVICEPRVLSGNRDFALHRYLNLYLTIGRWGRRPLRFPTQWAASAASPCARPPTLNSSHASRQSQPAMAGMTRWYIVLCYVCEKEMMKWPSNVCPRLQLHHQSDMFCPRRTFGSRFQEISESLFTKRRWHGHYDFINDLHIWLGVKN